MQSVLEGVAEENDLILLQRSAHPSVRQAVHVTGISFHEFDLSKLEEVRPFLRAGQRVLLVTEGIASLTGQVLPLLDLVELLENCDYRILVDDAHGLGVAGSTGRGSRGDGEGYEG